MVNLDKWEAITRNEIKIGDEIKRINVHGDGTRAVVTGVVARYERFSGVYMSAGSFALLRDSYHDAKVELYRRKKPTQEELDAKFVFPTGVGAVIESENRGEIRRYVYNGRAWHWTNTSSPAHRTETELRISNKSFKVISEGIK